MINRGNGRARVFRDDADYTACRDLFAPACERVPLRLLAYCLMPNHLHLVLWPREDGDLSRWMQWFLTAHVRRHHGRHKGSGHIWQGRFKAFPIQQDAHLLTVLRYVERNPRRASLVRRAENRPWSSLRDWQDRPRPEWLRPGPVDRPRGWAERVNSAETPAELEAIRLSLRRGSPYGLPAWTKRTAARLGMESAPRPRGRPRKAQEK